MTADVAQHFDWLPGTCAYRLRARGRSLKRWHPLLSGRPESVREAGVSVAGRVVSESTVDDADLEERIIHWVN